MAEQEKKIKNRGQTFKGFSSKADRSNYKLYDFELIKQDLINRLSVRKGERVENPEFGTNIWLYLFDPLDDELKSAVIEDVETIINYDPRVQLDKVEVNQYEHGLSVRVSVIYTGYGIGETMDMLFDEQQGLLTGPAQVYSAA